MLVSRQTRSKTPNNQKMLIEKNQDDSRMNILSKKNSNAFGSTQGGTNLNSSKNSTRQVLARHLSKELDTKMNSESREIEQHQPAPVNVHQQHEMQA